MRDFSTLKRGERVSEKNLTGSGWTIHPIPNTNIL